MKTTLSALLLISLGVPMVSHAESIPAPAIKPGDTWTYTTTVETTAANGWRQTHDKLVAVRATSDHLYVETSQVGGTQAPKELIVGQDWSRSRNVNGTETVVNRPLSFPLSEGESWEVKYTEAHPNPTRDSESLDAHFKVVGHETVEVPAGKFDAIKIEAEGDWTAQIAPGASANTGTVVNEAGTTIIAQTHKATSVTATGRIYKAFWYVPEVGRWVKSVEEYYSSNGTRNQRFSSELESYQRAAQ